VVECLNEIVSNNYRIMLDENADAAGVSGYARAHTIMHKVLKLLKISGRWVPKEGTEEHKAHQVKSEHSLVRPQ